jgi:PAS domain S-box-containing protein
MKDPAKTTEGLSAAKGKAQGERDNGGYAPEFRDLYHSFFEFAPDPMGVTEPDTVLSSMPTRPLKRGPATPRRASGEEHCRTRFWVHEEDRQAIIHRLYETQCVEGVEIDWKTGGGQAKNVLFSAKLIDTNHGKLVLFIGRDITERKRMEQVLRESERRLSDIIEFLPDATFVIDREGKVIAWNRAMEEMSGVSKKDMIGKSDHAYAVPFYGWRRKLLIDMVGETDENADSKYIYVKRSGHTIYAEAFTQALYDGKALSVGNGDGPSRRARQQGRRDRVHPGHNGPQSDRRKAQVVLRGAAQALRPHRGGQENERAAIARNCTTSWPDPRGHKHGPQLLNKKIPVHEGGCSVRSRPPLPSSSTTRTIQRVSSGLRPVVLDDFRPCRRHRPCLEGIP